jgi:hypothetical protein
MGKKHRPEEIIGKLREAENVMAQGGTASDACRRIGDVPLLRHLRASSRS